MLKITRAFPRSETYPSSLYQNVSPLFACQYKSKGICFTAPRQITVNSSSVLLQSLAESFYCVTYNSYVRWYRKSNALNKLPLCIFYIWPDGGFRNKPKHVTCIRQNASYPDAGYPDRLGPSGNHFLTVIILHLFMA
jgi:hypothetical protein